MAISFSLCESLIPVVVTNVVYEQRQVLETTEEVLNFFRTWGIRYALVENSEFLKGLDPVQKLYCFPTDLNWYGFSRFRGNDPNWAESVSLYRYRGELERANKSVVIPMLTIRSDIRADLSRLAGRPWPN